MSRLDIPVQQIKRVKTESVEAEATPVPMWRKERNKLVKEIIENERSSISTEAE
ncbi:hypothetical protein [uncultured Enterococcus sp.]|uniref:hypothetical protein n=1 Tax=uncultured Enterococcus sp. TaxID=167972 RepID=UPI002AA7F2E6|nr:hypothetical protein [uncultured Enterococcus sp.]